MTKVLLLLMFWRPLAIVLLGILVAACGSSSGSDQARWLEDTSAPLPARLSQVGIYADLGSRKAHEDMLPYVPKHPLYSNGLAKERYIHLAEGMNIDVGGDGWVFPVGTVLVKTFLDGDAPVETRLIFRTVQGWDYALYRWLPDATDAEQLEGNWAEVTVTLGDGERRHTLPSRLDCRTCHETHENVAGAPVLGISNLQTDIDLVDAGVFSQAPSLASVEGRTEDETAALGYFVGNCISCHNGGDSINSVFSLYPDEAVDNTVGEPTQSETGEGIRVVPGDPGQSVLYITVVEAGNPGYRGPFKWMPPIGVNTTDEHAEGILRDWIEGL
ncbi:MAG: hypothetical protein WCE62_22075 [Polyangiales bacterium]